MKKPKTGEEKKWWKAAVVGAMLSAGITALMCGAFSLIILNNVISEKNIGYASLMVLLCSVISGSYYSFRRTEMKKMVSALCAGGLYVIMGIVIITAIMRIGNINVPLLSAIVLGCCTIAVLLGTQKEGSNRKRKNVRMVKLNKKGIG